MGLQLRLANYKDKTVLLKQFRGLLSDDEEKSVNNATYTMLNTDKIQNPHSSPICFLVLEDVDTATIHGAIAFSSAIVYAIHIEQKFRNQGYGTLLMSAAAEYTKTANNDSMGLTATQTSIPFYERLGFKFEEGEGNPMRFGAKKGNLLDERFTSLCRLESFATKLDVMIDPFYTELLQQVELVKNKPFWYMGTAHDYIYTKKNTSAVPSQENDVSSNKDTKRPTGPSAFFNTPRSTDSTPLITPAQSGARCCTCAIL